MVISVCNFAQFFSRLFRFKWENMPSENICRAINAVTHRDSVSLLAIVVATATHFIQFRILGCTTHAVRHPVSNREGEALECTKHERRENAKMVNYCERESTGMGVFGIVIKIKRLSSFRSPSPARRGRHLITIIIMLEN